MRKNCILLDWSDINDTENAIHDIIWAINTLITKNKTPIRRIYCYENPVHKDSDSIGYIISVEPLTKEDIELIIKEEYE